MARKRLSDLLRAEAQPTSAPGNVSPSSIPPILPDQPIPQTQSPAPMESEHNQRIPELTASLEQAHRQIETLQGQLRAEQTLVQNLTTDLKQAQAKEKDLVKAQQQVKDLTAQLKPLQALPQQVSEQETLITKLYGEIQTLSAKLQTALETQKTLTVSQSPATLARFSLPPRYIAPAQPDSELSNEDIGWFD
ncbi:MAG: hypothetical protein ACKOX2_16865 [Microcystaceae cyanobacterium]